MGSSTRGEREDSKGRTGQHNVRTEESITYLIKDTQKQQKEVEIESISSLCWWKFYLL